MIHIQRSIPVKILLTEQSRDMLRQEYNRQIVQLQREAEQWEFQAKKLLHEAEKKSAEARQLVAERVEREERSRKEKLELLLFQLDQTEKLPLGSELLYTTVESSVPIKVGDNWNEIMGGTEIIVKDGFVHAIRQGGK